MDHRILPEKNAFEFCIVRNLADHDGAWRGSFEVSVSKLALPTCFFGKVNFARIYDEVPAPFCHTRHEQPMLFQIEGMEVVDGVVDIEYAVRPR